MVLTIGGTKCCAQLDLQRVDVVAVTRKLAEHSFAQTTFVLKYDRTTEVGFTSLSGKHWPVIAYGEETSMYDGTDIAYEEETSL